MIDQLALKRIHNAEIEMVARKAIATTDARIAEMPTPSLVEKPSKLITVGGAIEQMIALGDLPVYPTPFASLNDAIGFGGMLATGTYGVPGATGRGKTSWLIEVAVHHAANGGDSLIASGEMSAAYYVAKAAANELKISSNTIIREAGKRGKAILAAVPHRMYWLDKPSIADIRVEADRLAQKSGAAPLVFVDYLQKFSALRMRDMRNPDPRMAAAETSEQLLALAESVRCPLVIVNSTSRAAGRKTQSARDLAPYDLVDVSAESGSIEFDSTATIVLSLEDEYKDDERVATMTVAKARYGTECHIDARFNGAIGQWRDLGRIERVDRDLRAKILAALAEPADSKNEIHRRTKGDKPKVLREIDAMIKLGTIRRELGSYVLGIGVL